MNSKPLYLVLRNRAFQRRNKMIKERESKGDESKGDGSL